MQSTDILEPAPYRDTQERNEKIKTLMVELEVGIW